MKKLGVILFTFLFAGYGHAASEGDKIYFGGGLGLNSVSGIDFGDGIGFQFFGGYELPVKIGKGSLSAEVGYMETGDMDWGVPGFFGFGEINFKGVWANAVVNIPVQNNMNIVARAGLDFGDDDGLMIGGGLSFQVSSKMEIRAEYVIRDIVDSLQVNLVIRQ